VALPAVELSEKIVNASPATPIPSKPVWFTIVASPAVDVPEKFKELKGMLLYTTLLPALALPEKFTLLLELLPVVTKYWVAAELLMTPGPCMVRLRGAPPPPSINSPTAMVKGLASELKVTPDMLMVVSNDTLARFERSKVAVSAGLRGTVFGVQLAAVFQSLLLGSSFQVALPA